VDPSPDGEIELVGVLDPDDEDLVLDEGGDALQHLQKHRR